MSQSTGLPESVVIGECWARDGLQSIAKFISSAEKIYVLNRLQEIGLREIEATSFANPKYLPQFADAEQVLAGVTVYPDVKFRVVTMNLKAVERAAEARKRGLPIHEAGMVISASEAHNMANVKMTHDENKAVIEKMVQMCFENNIDVIGSVVTAFGCPITGDVPIENVVKLGKWWKELGVKRILFGDTTGMANPRYVSYFYEFVKDQGFAPEEVIVHFHDTRGAGIANNVAALQAGMKYFDTSLGAIGGQPRLTTGTKLYHQGFSGNTSTEDLVCIFEEMGINTGINVDGLLELGLKVEEIVGESLRSNVIRCGMVKH